MGRKHAILLLFGLCCLSLQAGATPRLRACVDEYPPQQRLHPKAEGENIAALEALSQLLSLDLVLVEGPNFARCLLMLDRGEVDVVPGIIPSEERARQYLLLPFRHDSRYVFVSHKGLQPLLRYEDLYGKPIAVSRNTLYFSRFDKDPALQKEQVGSLNTAIRMLLAERIQLVIVPEVNLGGLRSQFEDFDRLLQVNPLRIGEDRIIQFGFSRFHGLGLSEQTLRDKVETAFAAGVFEDAIREFIDTHPHWY
ncbi:substrate-binding periplasmic protein [Shewanella cyperi]|uniref:substrate-binding periplasmic protein n=1 Tax=Shewanella cyperi TaxID=2814292 RepID=UPI001A93F557|nr:transporter substrate-binding domain-containing protein [Shewanella cyperi]QSX39804.1 transporter substrate-binding domain-containing protein [Shewanella cyperi]